MADSAGEKLLLVNRAHKRFGPVNAIIGEILEYYALKPGFPPALYNELLELQLQATRVDLEMRRQERALHHVGARER